MKDIVNSIWNATPEQVLEFLKTFVLTYSIAMIIAIIGGYYLHKYISKQMGFGKEWDDKWKKFDEDFKRFK